MAPVRNSADSVAEFLGALASQTLPRADYEVILVDDCSTDGTAEAARATGVPDAVLATETWSGAYGARNVGLAAARGGVIALTDADCRPVPEWLESGLAALDAGADLVGGHIDVPLSERPSIAELVDFAHYLDQERGLEEGGFAVTANLFVVRRVLDAVGPFLEVPISDGDREFCLRAQEAGFTLAYSREAAVWHPPRTRMRDLSRRAFRDGYGLAQMRRHGGPHAERVPLIWRRPGAYVPGAIMRRRRGVYGMERIEGRGHRPSRTTLLRMELAEWLAFQLPMTAGNLAGWLREGRGGGR